MTSDFVKKAFSSGQVPNKVVLTGGFGDSQYLRLKLLALVEQLNEDWDTSIVAKFTPTNTSATSVAVGANMRGDDKRHGPSRAPRQNVAILRYLQCDTDEFNNTPHEV